MFQVEGWIMPEMPGVMTDILISMDDRSRFLFFAIFPRTSVRNYFENLFQIGLCPHSKLNEESGFVDCESPQVPLLLQLAARRREAVRHH